MNCPEYDYDLELEKVAKFIKIRNVKTVCIQLPDGLKPKADEIADYIEKNTKAKVLIWAGSCYGGCDIPRVDADLLVQWGHTEWL
ncbi:MAG: diphthamide synthesis protein [Candidatus Woesearchaeota archaeon]